MLFMKKETKTITVKIDEKVDDFIKSIIENDKFISYQAVIKKIIKFYYEQNTNDKSHIFNIFKENTELLNIKDIFKSNPNIKEKIIKNFRLRIDLKHYQYISEYSDLYFSPKSEVVYLMLKQFIQDYLK